MSYAPTGPVTFLSHSPMAACKKKDIVSKSLLGYQLVKTFDQYSILYPVHFRSFRSGFDLALFYDLPKPTDLKMEVLLRMLIGMGNRCVRTMLMAF